MDTTYLDETALSERYHVSRRTLQRWRVTGEGPPFVRLGLRRLVYRLADAEAWAQARTHEHRASEIAALTATK